MESNVQAQINRPPAGHSTKARVSRTTFYDNFVKTGRIRLVHIGARAVGVVDTELDAVVDDVIAERDTGSAQRNPHNQLRNTRAAKRERAVG